MIRMPSDLSRPLRSYGDLIQKIATYLLREMPINMPEDDILSLAQFVHFLYAKATLESDDLHPEVLKRLRDATAESSALASFLRNKPNGPRNAAFYPKIMTVGELLIQVHDLLSP